MGDMGLGDTPLPPADPSQMPPPPMGGDMGGDPMGGMPPGPDAGGDPMAGGADGSGIDDDLMNVLNGMPKDKQDAVRKYAESMAGDDQGAQGGQEMPNESVLIGKALSEAIRKVKQNREDRETERKDTDINPKVDRSNPFHDKW